MRTFWIVPSFTEKDIYYLFRDEGAEIEFKIEKGRVYSVMNLKPEEIAYIYRYFIPNEKEVVFTITE